MTSLVVMGVSGCGKSCVGAVVAGRLGLPLIEGDEFHSEANRARMRDGLPLTDADRIDWFDRLCAELRLQAGGAVLTCSALKASYRDRLRSASPGLRFAWLDLDPASAEDRVAKRAAHFFPKGLVASQFEALESPAGEPGVLRLDALLLPEAIAEHVVRWTAEHDASCAPAQDETTMKARKRPCIALIAHNLMKDRMVALAREFRDVLARYSLVATGTTGARLRSQVGLEVECLLSGPMGGDLQIGARLAVGDVQVVIFLRDPMTPQPHEPDINALVRACDVHDVACATNVTTARRLLRQIDSEGFAR